MHELAYKNGVCLHAVIYIMIKTQRFQNIVKPVKRHQIFNK